MLYAGIIFIIIVGTLLHFVYELSHHNKFVGIFAAVNESTWEHIKIGMTATILWSLVDGFVYGADENYIIAKALSLLTIIILIPLLFYFYTAFTKKSILIVDIISFCITIICSQLVFNHIMSLYTLPFEFRYISGIILFIELVAYIFLTYNPLKNFIFKDPITKKYGVKGHSHNHDHDHK